jgi:hypothetical protein
MEVGVLQWIIGQSGMAGLAAFAIWLMDQRHKEHAREKDTALQREMLNVELHRQDKERLIEVLRQNAEVNVRLIATLNHLDERLTQVEQYLRR